MMLAMEDEKTRIGSDGGSLVESLLTDIVGESIYYHCYVLT